MNFTKGPWFVEDTRVFSLMGAFYIAETQIKGMCFTKSGDEAVANAHLIAAAPEMLEALNGARVAIVAEIKRRDRPHWGLENALGYIESALEKARGGK